MKKKVWRVMDLAVKMGIIHDYFSCHIKENGVFVGTCTSGRRDKEGSLFS